jgi:hypothetical protein
MDFIQPQSRTQVWFSSLEEKTGTDYPVCLIDAFAEQLDLQHLGFGVRKLNAEGRPAFTSVVLPKLYLFGLAQGHAPTSLITTKRPIHILTRREKS